MQPKNTPSSHEPVVDRPVVRPAVDIYENQDELLLIVDLPGVRSDAISVDLDKETLTIQAKRADAVPEHGRVVYGEAASWDYKRVFTVPEAVDAERIRADFKHGVLEVHLPRHERTKPRRINIQSGSAGAV